MNKPLDDYNGIFSYEKSFKEWLDNRFTSRASSDYPSRMRHFFINYYLDRETSIQGKHIYNQLHQLPMDTIEHWIDLCIQQAENISDNKKRKNIISAFKKFREFLQQKKAM